MKTLHIATLPTGKFLLVGSLDAAEEFMLAPAYQKPEYSLDSETLKTSHFVDVPWLAENNIKRVIHL